MGPPQACSLVVMLIRNTTANLAGQLVYPILALLLVPFYLRHLGLEGYGLIGLMALVTSLLGVFSRGLGGALQREISRRIRSDDALTLRRLVHSLEAAYWAIGGALALLLGGVAMSLGPAWVKTEHLSATTVTTCLGLLAVRVSVAFPHSVYQSVFVGTERQVLGSLLNAALALAAAASGVLAVVLFGSVVAFFASEVANATAGLFILRRFAFHVLPPGRADFDAGEIRGLIRISLALIWTSGVGLLLANLDRLFVSAVMPVASLAIYTLAVMGGRLVTLIYNPFLQAAYPRMCHVARSGSPEEQSRDLLRNAAVLIVIAAACGLPLCAFAPEVLAIWVRDHSIVRAGAAPMSFYVAAMLLIAFASVFYQWQTATGQTAIAVRFNAIALLWFPIALWVLVSEAGLLGASIAWTAYGALAWITNLAATFGKGRLPASALREYLRLTAAALAPAVLCTVLARWIANTWFADSLAARVTCAALAGACGGLAAFRIVFPRFGPTMTVATESQPGVEVGLSPGGL
jgi:O-antigen/teichoic acid export membrane protein